MTYEVYCIKDVKSDFWPPMVSTSVATAKREFAMMANRNDSMIHQFPNDYELYYVGTFDSKVCTFEFLKLPEFVCRADEIVGANYEK